MTKATNEAQTYYLKGLNVGILNLNMMLLKTLMH